MLASKSELYCKSQDGSNKNCPPASHESSLKPCKCRHCSRIILEISISELIVGSIIVGVLVNRVYVMEQIL